LKQATVAARAIHCDRTETMRILVTGATGLVGRALLPFLAEHGETAVPLVRAAQAGASAPWWNPDQQHIQLGAGGFDAVMHLAGENIAERWTAAKKARIRASRVDGTRLLSAALARSASPPKVLVCASATGFYGDRGDAWLDEDSQPGQGFLAEVCQEWEAAAREAMDAGIRVVHLRLGIVLAADGGALAKMRPVFRAGLGGQIGSGRQYWSWIALDDVLGALRHALFHEELRGPVNAVAPSPVQNAEFTAALARGLRRPAALPVPAFAARLLFGEMAQATLLASARVRPSRLLASGFAFQFPDLEPALRHLLARWV
jgi:hypothetical protein